MYLSPPPPPPPPPNPPKKQQQKTPPKKTQQPTKTTPNKPKNNNTQNISHVCPGMVSTWSTNYLLSGQALTQRKRRHPLAPGTSGRAPMPHWVSSAAGSEAGWQAVVVTAKALSRNANPTGGTRHGLGQQRGRVLTKWSFNSKTCLLKSSAQRSWPYISSFFCCCVLFFN